MKYKVGDKLKIIDNISKHGFKKGEKIKIFEIDEKDYLHYGCKSIERDNACWWVCEEEVVLDYTWEDFLKAPVGTKITFEDGSDLIKYSEKMFEGTENVRHIDRLQDFYDNDGIRGKIIKIEEPTYTTVYEPKEEIVMPEIEEMKRLTDELCKTCEEFINKIKEK